MTHTDPKAEFGAIAVALATLLARRNENLLPDAYLQTISRLIGHKGEDLLSLLREACRSVNEAESTTAFAEHLGLSRGVSGYTYHTVPVVIHAWLSHQRDYRKAVTAVIECGGDADTTAAIVGGIVGTAVGVEGIPARWIETICEWPRTVPWMQRLSEQLDQSLISASPMKPIGLNPIAVLLRNALFLLVVLFHGFRRLFPPY
jgi:ADP-ribosylglycohydrolase